MRNGSRNIAGFVDRCVNLIKWPSALLAVVATIPAALSLVGLIADIHLSHRSLLPQVLAGLAVYCVAWWVILKRTRISFFSTLEHEVTHALFAVLTLHRVTGIRSSLRSGGKMEFRGKGNWLITISPYFFPTATVVVCAVLTFCSDTISKNAGLLFGASLGYHFVSTWNETHRGQSDLKKVGFFFAFLFLPFANVAAIGLCLAWFRSGFGGCLQYLSATLNEATSLWSTLR